MTELGISTSIISLTAPGCTLLSGPGAVNLAREVNESAASIRDSDPSSFGFFAALPPILEDIPAALTEIAYALDVLKADGVTLTPAMVLDTPTLATTILDQSGKSSTNAPPLSSSTQHI